MANVKLSKYEVKRRLLPRVCMVCGEPSETHKSKSFSWHTPLAYLGLLAGLLPFVIIALILTKRMTVDVPLCSRHKGHWSKRTLLVLGSFFGCFVIGLGFGIYQSDQPPGNDSSWMCLAIVGLLLVWLIIAAVAQTTAIRATEITDTSIKLTKVHTDFVNALREERSREREDDRGDRFGDERDDYDDGRQDEPRRQARPRDDDDDRRPPRRRDRDDDDRD